MKQRIYRKIVDNVQILKDIQMERSHPIPRSVPETMKDNLSETRRGTEHTLTGAETSRDITGTETGVRNVKVIVIVIGTDGTIEITTTIARIEIVLHTVIHTGTGTLSVAEKGLRTTTGSVTTTGPTTLTTTGPEMTGAVSGGDTVIPLVTGLMITGSGKRRDEIPG